MKKAILFGANGYLGRHIAKFLEEKGINFIPADIDETSVDHHSNYQKIDVTNKNALQQLDFNVDLIYVFAGLTGTKNSPDVIERYTQVNVEGLRNILDRCEDVKGVRIVFPSTRLVYKGVEDKPLPESAEKEAKTIYAQNKLDCEKMLADSPVDYTIFRICVPYGNLIDENYSYGTIGFFLNKALNSENITLYGDGSLKRTFTHVSDLANIIIEGSLTESTKNEVYNIASNDALSLLQVANLVAKKYGVGVDHVEWPEEALKVESGDTIFDDQKLKSTIAVNYNFSLQEWIEGIS